ncbi:MAG: 16S rRNA (uracil(1498)-N(3))-methyltransferase [Crocinitomicaceae bacterium]|jgi:16S rRNA (uracil1498-N3)-methyltransferase|nr:16S rRNA (uracil(1498)-N(3))-methyltransferase [Crocinitomicaceae bacterium]
MQLFYSENISGQTHTLPEQESKHLIKVLRKSIGDNIQLTDGLGNLFRCRIKNDHPKKCILEIIQTENQPDFLKRSIHIAIAPTKSNDRFEWFIEKATEIGVSSITPILCKHSERQKINQERLHKVAVSAMKQSNRLHLPEINSITSLTEFIKNDTSDTRLLAHCLDYEKIELSDIKLGNSICILIGPEGDFSEQEITHVLKANYLPVSLGSSRLRTETAGIVACVMMNNL